LINSFVAKIRHQLLKDDNKTEQQVLLGLRVGKKTKKREKRTNRALKVMRKEKKKSNKSGNGVPHFSALNLIYDPQDFAEKLFKLVETTNEGFEIKLSILDVISRLIGVHSLFLLNFHSFLIRFLNPHQRGMFKKQKSKDLSKRNLTYFSLNLTRGAKDFVVRGHFFSRVDSTRCNLEFKNIVLINYKGFMG
jgi:hypothetical protein